MAHAQTRGTSAGSSKGSQSFLYEFWNFLVVGNAPQKLNFSTMIKGKLPLTSFGILWKMSPRLFFHGHFQQASWIAYSIRKPAYQVQAWFWLGTHAGFLILSMKPIGRGGAVVGLWVACHQLRFVLFWYVWASRTGGSWVLQPFKQLGWPL